MLSNKLFNQPILSLRSGTRVGKTLEPIVDPSNLKIVGWWCESPLYKYPMVLLSDDIREFSSRGLIIDDNDALTDPDDLHRHKEILKIKFKLIDKVVKTKSQKIGKVNDFSYNDGLFIQKLYVAKPLHKLLSADSVLIIDRTQIIEITHHHILVKSSEIEAKSTDVVSEPAIA